MSQAVTSIAYSVNSISKFYHTSSPKGNSDILLPDKLRGCKDVIVDSASGTLGNWLWPRATSVNFVRKHFKA